LSEDYWTSYDSFLPNLLDFGIYSVAHPFEEHSNQGIDLEGMFMKIRFSVITLHAVDSALETHNQPNLFSNAHFVKVIFSWSNI
jgi:hypothetical protein